MQSPLATDRGKLRMERLRQLELEQLQWEQEALVMPEDLNRALFLSFESVKTEFSDLDGLSWSRYPVPLVANPWAVEEPTPKLTSAEIDAPSHARTPSPPRCPPPRPIPYPHADMHAYAQDTIRLTPSRSPLQPANQFFSAQYGASHGDPQRSPYAQPSQSLACHSLRHPAYGHG